MTNATRATVDFEAFARELAQPHPAQQPDLTATRAAPAAAGKGDPLAELARIVGQDDPFRALLEARDGRRDAGQGSVHGGGRIEPRFEAAPQPAPHYAQAQPTQAHHAQVHADTPADAFDQYLASVERDYPPEHGYAPADEAPEAEPQGRPLKRVAPRRRLLSVGAGLGVLVLCVTGALTWRGLHSGHTEGGVPVIKADTAPLKIAPKTADGVVIPDQNKQIYEPKAKDGQIRIVNREEQPLDVAQAARSSGGESSATTPGAGQGGFGEAFGEPRRVRTVSVKPDTPAPPREQAETQTPSVIPTMTLPEPAGAAPKPRPVRQAAAMPAPVPTPTEPAPAAEATPVPPPAPSRPKAPQRVAAVAPEATAPVEAPATTAATSASTAPVGGFSVQLGVRNSQGDAQAAFRQMQAKYTQLAGKPALIREAEVNGKTIFRVRVGPLEKAEATSLCAQLQGQGGQCFVAKN
jgi:hypothetical protein